MPTARNAPGGVVGVDGKIYVIGGSTVTGPNGATAAVERFDERTQQWESVAPLPATRAGVAVARDRTGQIWVFGGHDFAVIADTIYRYDLAGDRWITAGTMPVPLSEAVAEVDSVGFIYLIGGVTPTENATALVQRFDPNDGSWLTLPPLNTQRWNHAAFIDGNDRIFVAGGSSSPQVLNSVECLDLRNLAAGWVPKAPMPTARQTQGCKGADGLMYAVGGWDGWFVSRVDRYDPATDSWSEYAPLNFGNNTMAIVSAPSGRLYSIGGESSPMVKTPRVEYTMIRPNSPPTINCPDELNIGCSTEALVPVTFNVTATDDSDVAPTVICEPPSGSSYGLGSTMVKCTATDSVGASSYCAFNVVRETLGFTGFLAPISGADATGGSYDSPLRTFKMGSTIPMKFMLSCEGAAVVNGVHRLQVIKYAEATTSEDPIDASPQDAATDGNEFRFSDGEWHFNLATKATGMSIGRWQVIATLSDGSQHLAWIQIK